MFISLAVLLIISLYFLTIKKTKQLNKSISIGLIMSFVTTILFSKIFDDIIFYILISLIILTLIVYFQFSSKYEKIITAFTLLTFSISYSLIPYTIQVSNSINPSEYKDLYLFGCAILLLTLSALIEQRINNK